MVEPLKVLNATRLDGDVMVEFSDDTSAVFTAEELLSLNKRRSTAASDPEEANEQGT